MVVQHNLQAINAIGRSDIFLKLEIIKKFMGILALIISMQFSPLAVAFSLIITGCISTFINSAPNRRLLEYSYKEQLSDLLPPLLLSIVMGLIVYPITFCNMPDFLIVIIQVLLGGICYLFGSVATKQKGFIFLKRIFFKKIGFQKSQSSIM